MIVVILGLFVAGVLLIAFHRRFVNFVVGTQRKLRGPESVERWRRVNKTLAAIFALGVGLALVAFAIASLLGLIR